MKVSEKHQERMFDLAHRIKLWSDCPHGRQHACLLALDGKYIVSTGYNGMNKGLFCIQSHACETYSKKTMQEFCMATHAEENALRNLPIVPPYNLVAYVTKKPCTICTAKLKEFGIRSVYWQEWHKGYIVDSGYKKL